VIKDFFSMSPCKESIKLVLPALLYVIQNNLLFVALSNLSVPTYQVTNQGKLLTTAIISRIMLKKQISTMQYVSLLVLGLGVAVVNLSEHRINSQMSSVSAASEDEDEQNTTLGLLAVMISCITSGFCGVYFELVLKTTAKISVHKRNFQLAFWSFLLAAMSILFNPENMSKIMKNGLFQGFDLIVISVIICQALTGLVVSLMLKYADAILKGFAISVAVIVASAASIFLFDSKVSFLFFVGVAMVVAAGKIYASFPYGKKVDFAELCDTASNRGKISMLMGIIGLCAVGSFYTKSSQLNNSNELLFTTAHKEMFRLPSDDEYDAKYGAYNEFISSEFSRVSYLRNKNVFINNNSEVMCSSTLDVFAWLSNKVNIKDNANQKKEKNLFMLTYGTLLHFQREKHILTNPETNKYIDKDIDMWASPDIILTILKLEEELYHNFGWTMRGFVNSDNCIVFLQLFATCGHKINSSPLPATSDQPAIEISPFSLLLENNSTARAYKDLWLGTIIPESMIFPELHVDFTILSNNLVHLKTPRAPLDILLCLCGTKWIVRNPNKHAPKHADCRNHPV